MNMVKPLESDRMFNETATASLSFTGMFYVLDTVLLLFTGAGVWIIGGRRSMHWWCLLCPNR